ncbi:vesicle transport protein SFT2B-like isoform X2 [Clavelina lepadiformis]|uniref:Vesicle transport protein n=1 Tax=Clavelina lepadiformis TaxID=159417 RepID=A0ABP0EZY4_CLALP
MDKLRKVLNGQENDGGESGLVTSVTGGGDSCCPSLSWETRIKGFIACCALGILMSVLGAILFFWSTTAFAFLYTIGTLTAIGSTLFLRGPMSQMKSMFKETRIFATIVMLLMIVLTVCAAAWWHNGGLCILFCVLQFLAFAWYSISYIPFARDTVKKCFTSCIS